MKKTFIVRNYLCLNCDNCKVSPGAIRLRSDVCFCTRSSKPKLLSVSRISKLALSLNFGNLTFTTSSWNDKSWILQHQNRANVNAPLMWKIVFWYSLLKYWIPNWPNHPRDHQVKAKTWKYVFARKVTPARDTPFQHCILRVAEIFLTW